MTNGDSLRCSPLCCTAADMVDPPPWHSSLHSSLESAVLMEENGQTQWEVLHTGSLERRERCDLQPVLLVQAELLPSPSPGLFQPPDPLTIQPTGARGTQETCCPLQSAPFCQNEQVITKVTAHLHAIKAVHTLTHMHWKAGAASKVLSCFHPGFRCHRVDSGGALTSGGEAHLQCRLLDHVPVQLHWM